jgi:hypothetical protein
VRGGFFRCLATSGPLEGEQHVVKDELVEVSSYKRDQRLFRYLEIEKLLFMMTRGALPLTRISLFDDPYEGSYPKKYLEVEREALVRAFGERLVPKEYKEDPGRFLKKSREMAEDFRRNHFVSCWHASSFESEAMWRLYSSYHKGVAIETDLQSLIEELPPEYDHKTRHRSPIGIGEMHYIDFESPDMRQYVPSLTIVRQWQWKRKAFSFENEVRIHTFVPCGYGNEKEGVVPEVEGDCILLTVDLSRVIHRIVIAPKSPSWYRELISSVIHKYGFDFRIDDSALAGEPIHMFWGHIGQVDV